MIVSAKEKNIQIVTDEWLTTTVKKFKPKSKPIAPLKKGKIFELYPYWFFQDAHDISLGLAVSVFKSEPTIETKSVVTFQEEIRPSVIRKPVQQIHGSTGTNNF